MSPLSYKIVWWNIEKGLTDEKFGGGHLSAGLFFFSKKVNADIIILGEYLSDKPLIEESFFGESLSDYTKTFIPYNCLKSTFGFLVLSKIPFNIKKKELLEWYPTEGAEGPDRHAYIEKWKKTPRVPEAFERDFVILEFVGPEGERFDVTPIHQLQPWGRIAKASKWGIFKTILSVVSCKTNPLYWQTSSLIRRTQDHDLNKMIVIGDFNISPRFLGFGTSIYSILSKAFVKVPCKGRSFPADKSPAITDYFGLQLDHAFLRVPAKSAKAEILKLRGSDHYPLLLEIEF